MRSFFPQISQILNPQISGIFGNGAMSDELIFQSTGSLSVALYLPTKIQAD